MSDSVCFDDTVIVISSASRTLRRQLRPLAWVTLEELALDAVVENGRLVARTSARQVAERLGINPGTANEALRVLGRHGLVSLEREKGPAGRFGLSVYHLGPVPGISAAQPCVAEPFVVRPPMASPQTGAPLMESRGADARDAGPADRWTRGTVVDSDRRGVTDAEPAPRRPGRARAPAEQEASLVQCPGQEALDFGSVSS